MRALPLMLGAVMVVAIAYRYYSAFIATKVLVLDDTRVTPAYRFEDGHNYVPTNKWVLFGHHFAAITGAGPLVGPVLAAQFGFLPGYLWILIGVVLGGAVHDFVILSASVRRDGKSLAEIVRAEIGPSAGLVAGFAVLFIVVIAIAAMAKVVVTALAESPWGTFTIGMTVPIALFMGLYMHRIRPGRIREASAIGVVLLLFSVGYGKTIASSPFASSFLLSEHTLTLCLAGYGFVASVLPVWMLLCPRDYLSSYMKLGTIVLLILGIVIVNPRLEMPAVSQFTNGGPIVPGKLFPFVFITIACGAISGFHGLVASGTTPKMIEKESHARPIGYGAMLGEAIVGVVALIAAASLSQGDYFAINTPPDKFALLGMSTEHLPELAEQIGERLDGRPGGAVSLAVGISQVFSSLPGFRHLMSYWYHFAIMFEALFILTTVDTGTRVARFLVQEFGGRLHPKFAQTDWMPGTVLATSLVCVSWGYFVWSGSIATIWPMLGISNQLLACIALAAATTMIVNAGRGRYAWVTLVPLAFVGTATQWAGYQLITSNFVPRLIRGGKPELVFQGWLLSGLCALAMTAMLVIVAAAGRRWLAAWRG
ncbi:MAG: carbon starvation protein A [Deltaproteobacteria bacterium]|nr:carbon starvation protein A [Deltaproteobacteria bacterium]